MNSITGTPPPILSIWKAVNREIRNPELDIRPETSGLTRPGFVLMVVHSPKRDPADCTYLLNIFDPESGSWTRLPPGPQLFEEFMSFSTIGVVAVGTKIIVVASGVDKIDLIPCADNDPISSHYPAIPISDKEGYPFKNIVYVFDLLNGEWRQGASLPGTYQSMYGLASDPIHQRVLVASVTCRKGLNNSQRMSLIYDVAKDTWVHLPNMEKIGDTYVCGVVFQPGSFHVIHENCAESLDPDTLQWGPANYEFPEASKRDYWVTGNGEGDVYFVGQNLTLQHGNEDEWEAIAKLPNELVMVPDRLPDYIKLQPIDCVTTWRDKMMVISKKAYESYGIFHKGYVMDLNSRDWTKVDLPKEYLDHTILCCGIDL